MTAPGPSGRLLIDITELFENPVRTGIQRVVREMLRHWPSDGPAPRTVRFDPKHGLLGLSAAAVALLTEHDDASRHLPYAELRAQLHSFAGEPLTELEVTSSPVLLPEVFYDPARCQFYERRLAAAPGSVAMLFYDFLPFLRPDLFKYSSILPYMSYARLACMAPHAAFISHQTQQEYANRFLHRRNAMTAMIEASGPVLPLGADGLALERQVWAPQRQLFASIGSIDGRKNQHLIVAAFMRLWDAGYSAPLVLIGRRFDGVAEDWIEAARHYPQFRWLDAATDADLAAVLREARATIYVSDAEGYGLPPVESLAVGIPVIASASVPSLAMLPPGGQVRLVEVTVEAIADAVRAMKPDAAARRLWREAASLQLGTWYNFAVQTAEWCKTFVEQPSLEAPATCLRPLARQAKQRAIV